MELLTARQLFDQIVKATGQSDERGNASIAINVSNILEAKATIAELKRIKSNLKLVKRRGAHIQALIRAESSKDFRNIFLSDLIKKNFGRRPEEGNVAVKKQTLISLYKQTALIIDDLVIQIDEIIPRLEDYVIRNR